MPAVKTPPQSPILHSAADTPPPSPILEGAGPDRMKIWFICAVEQTSLRIQFDIHELLRIPLSNEPWNLCCVPTDQIEPDNSDWDQIKSAPGIYVAGKSHNGKFYEVAVDGSYIPWLRLHQFDFELGLNYNPTKPVDAEVRVHGAWEARRRAEARFLRNAAKAIRSRRDRGLESCYRKIAPSRLQIPLEWALLNHDILESKPRVRNKFTQCLVFLGLNLLKNYDSPPALELLEKDQDELLQVFRKGHTDLSKARSANDRSCIEIQSISLVRRLLEFSGGRKDFRQHTFDQEYTANDNANLYGSLIGITGSNYLGNFESQKMLAALSRSKVFTNDDIRTLDIAELSLQMRTFLPIGHPQDLHLPAELLSRLGFGQVDLIRVQIAHIYHWQPPLKKPENNVLVLLTWSSTVGGLLQVLSEWAASDDGLNLQQRLIGDIQDSQTTEQLALTLAALLCFKRLLSYTSYDTTRSTRGCYLADFDALLNAEPLSNERTVCERMVFSFLRVLDTFNDDYQDMRQFLATVLDADTPLLEPLDGFSDQYWERRIKGRLTHENAFGIMGLQCLLETTVGLDTDDEEDWVMLESLQL